MFLSFKGRLGPFNLHRDHRIEWGAAARQSSFLFFLSCYDRTIDSVLQDRDTISLSPRTRVMPLGNDSALSCIRSNHSLLDVGVTSLYAVVLDLGVCYSNHGAALFLTSGDFTFLAGEDSRIYL